MKKEEQSGVRTALREDAIAKEIASSDNPEMIAKLFSQVKDGLIVDNLYYTDKTILDSVIRICGYKKSKALSELELAQKILKAVKKNPSDTRPQIKDKIPTSMEDFIANYIKPKDSPEEKNQ